MKVPKFLTLISGAVVAVKPVTAENDATTTLVRYMTSTYTVTQCAGTVSECPSSGTDVFTSTTVMSVTTTICPVSSIPGVEAPTSATLTMPVPSSTGLLDPIDTTNTLSDAVPTSFAITSPGTSGVNVPASSPAPTHAVNSTGTFSVADPTSYHSVTSGSVEIIMPPVFSTAQPTDPTQGTGLSSMPVVTGTLSDSVPTSFPGSISVSSATSNSSIPSQSVGNPTSNLIPIISGPATNTLSDSVPTSFPANASASWVGPTAVPIFTLPTPSFANTSVVVPRPSPAVSIPVTDTLSDSVPTSFGVGISSSATNSLPLTPITTPSATGTLTQNVSSPAEGSVSGLIPTLVSSGLSTLSDMEPTMTSADPIGPVSSGNSTSAAANSTTRITSYQTVTKTNFITSLTPTANPSINTETDGVSTSHGTSVSGAPSASGFPYPSGTGNTTVATPRPSIVEVPVNMGQMMSVGSSSVAAVVVALGFALFA